MNSITIQSASSRIDRELIRFQYPDEWQERTAFRWALTVTERDLSHFVGGYNLARELYQRCGLCHGGKPCNQEHGHGFVVATKEGLETQVGKDCGLRHLGAKFEELERSFTAAVNTEDLMKRMSELIGRQDAMMFRAQQAITDCDRASVAVGEIKHRIAREPGLADVFRHAVNSDGSVYAEVRVSDREYEDTRKRYRREIFGRIDGIGAATAKSPKADIQAIVLPLVRSLTPDMLRNLTSKSLAAKSKEAGDAERVLVEADAFVALCRRFTARRNWESFALAFEPGRLATNDRGRRLLKQVADLAT